MVWPDYRGDWEAKIALTGRTIIGLCPTKAEAQSACDTWVEKQVKENW
jgi:hypothetical protein